LYEAGGQSWPDVNKISSFRNGLNSALRSRLAQQLILPRIYSEFLRICQQLSSKTAAPPYATAPKLASDPMDVSELTIGALTPGTTALTPVINMPPGVTTQIGAISSDLIVRPNYRQTGQCFRCGSSSHRVKDCLKSSSSTGKRVTIAAINDDSSIYDSDDSDGVGIERQAIN
jgi:hypothetical protein